MITRLLDLTDMKNTGPDVEEPIAFRSIPKKDIAIIGMSCRIAGANDPEQFWEALKRGKDYIREFPGQRKSDIDLYMIHCGIDQQSLSYRKYGYIDDIDKFDRELFKIVPREAELMDPKQRLFLETVWSTAEDAGYGGSRLKGTRTGVYIGYCGDFDMEYADMVRNLYPSLFPVATPGNIRSVIAGRIAYMLDLRGPAMVVDTACSSSLVAIHTACRALRGGECDLAFAGAVKLYLAPVVDDNFDIGIMSSSGRTKAFDEMADGTGLGEGTAAVLLKPLNKALEDGDHIYAVIKGSAVNQDGNSVSMTAPNSLAQGNVITAAWEDAGIDPASATCIEAHGTGTKLGDPVEMEGIRRAIGRFSSRKQFCAVGSVKSNVGHLDNAAGIAGLLKIVLALKHGQIPPSIHFSLPNTRISFEELPVYVNDTLIPWETENVPRRCGVSSFGLSGTNCHIVLEEAPRRTEPTGNPALKSILALSAMTEYSLRSLVKRYSRYLDGNPQERLEDICYTANTGRGHYEYRLAILASSMEDLKEKLGLLKDVQLDAINLQNVFFGRHILISGGRSKHGRWEITGEEKRELWAAAERLLKESMSGDGNFDGWAADICAMYARGADVDWDVLYKEKKYRRVCLPVYAYDRKRCWAEIPENNGWDRDHYHSVRWRTDENIREHGPVHEAANILVFADHCGISGEVCGKLREKGCRVMEVARGSVYQRTDADRFEVSGCAGDYERLIPEIKELNIHYILHLSSIIGDTCRVNTDNIEEMLESGAYGLFRLVKAALKHKLGNGIQYILVSNHVNEITGRERGLNPAGAALFGLGRVLGQEYGNISVRSVDIDTNQKQCSEQIIRELQAKTGEYACAYREGNRYVETICDMDIGSFENRRIHWRENGVYIITGGCGGIGFEIARHMASRNRINLVLINRTEIPERAKWEQILQNKTDNKLCIRIRNLMEIEKEGSGVICRCADVADKKQMFGLMEELRKQYGKINGIIHCAGIAGDGFIIHKPEEIFKSVLSPKVSGTLVLDESTRNDDLDFFALFSSAASVTGGMGQGDYTAANAFMDSFAAYRNKSGKRTLVIDWTAWTETGMAVDYRADTGAGFTFGICTSVGTHAFFKVLERNISRALIGKLNMNIVRKLTPEAIQYLPQLFNRSLEDRAGGLTADLLPVPDNKTTEAIVTDEDTFGYTKVQKRLAAVWTKVTGITEISIYANFYDSGGNSILAAQLAGNLEKEYPGLLDITDIYSHPTIAELSEYIEQRMEEQSSCKFKDMDEILRKVESGAIPVEEAAKLMEMVGDHAWKQ